MKRIVLLFTLLLLSNQVYSYDYTIGDKNITYNEDELKFYENGVELNAQEVQNLYPEREIVLISRFDRYNKYKLKKSFFKSKKIVLLNDTNTTFQRFNVYPESSRYINQELKSLITIYGKKNVRLKHPGGDEFEIVVK